MPVLHLLLALQAPIPADAYADPRARELVALARIHRETIDRSIRSYRVLAKERIGVGIRALRRDRMLYRRELAARVEWQRDSIGRIEVLGARQAIPAALPGAQVAEDLNDAIDLAFDPADDELMIGMSDSEFVRHPLAPGSEADYRYESGDSTTLSFPDGRTLRLYELRVIPRRQDFNLMSGSLWIESQDHAVVRALFRPARPFDFQRDIADESDDIPGFVGRITAEVRYVAIEYALFDRRWWLPRLLALDATASVGSWLTTPLRFERLYADYEVQGDSTPRREPRRTTPPDSAERAAARDSCKALGEDVHCECEEGRCLAFRLDIPKDTMLLLTNAELPPAFVGLGDSILAAGELGDIGRALGSLPAAPWQVHVEPPAWGLLRYNRVEALSLGVRQEIDFGRLRLAGLARIGVADWEPEVQLHLVRETGTARFRLGAYRRLAEADPATEGLGLGNSLNAFLFGRDDGAYFRAWGGELTAVPALTRPQRWELRLFAERQRAVAKETDFSIPHVFDKSEAFRDNLTAQPADAFGAALGLHMSRPLGAAGATLGADLTLDGSGGDFEFGRAALTLRANVPIAGLAGALEVAGGTSTGTVPVQRAFFLGGPQTLRGYGGAAAAGDAFWRVRAEVANRWPAARLALFADAGRADSRTNLTFQHPLIGVGIGASFLDGLFRIDVSRAIVAPKGWRVDFYTDGIL
jgi:hypothetical protein